MRKLPIIAASLLTFIYTLLLSTTQAQQKIGLIDLYGNYTVPAADIRKQLGVKEGDSLNPERDTKMLVEKLKKLPGVHNAAISFICCDQQTNGGILFVGIAESDKELFTYHQVPDKNLVLPAEVTATHELLMTAWEKAVKANQAIEDDSLGYTLLRDSTARQLQLKFVGYTQRYMPQLIAMLHDAADAHQRAAAADVIAYTDDKKAVAPHLLYAVQDPADGVRNNATRALGVMGNYANLHPEAGITIPPTLFINMLKSLVWTDRNKGAWTLLSLTQQRDPVLLNTLKREALPQLIEMARWHSKGHAAINCVILARIAGASDDEAFAQAFSDNGQPFLEDVIRKIEAGGKK